MNGQSTKVFLLNALQGERLAEKLTRSRYQFRPASYARFQACGEGVTATLYESGKLVVQGREIGEWCLRYLGEEGAAADAAQLDQLNVPDTAAGSDEAGKGDTFGPLVVCAVGVSNGGAARLRAAGVMDSKRLRDERVRTLAAWVRKEFVHCEVVVEPDEYNHLYVLHGENVNHLLAKLHEEALLPVLRGTGASRVVVDRFAADCPVTRRLKRHQPDLEVHEVPRGERHPAVAAASVLARDRFLDSMERLAEFAAVDLPKGSGSEVQPALRRFLQLHPRDDLRRAAKLHFRNVQAVLLGQA